MAYLVHEEKSARSGLGRRDARTTLRRHLSPLDLHSDMTDLTDNADAA